jgi:asparagine synthase (glutamine-hydrolysing)
VCGIAGMIRLDGDPIPSLTSGLAVMNDLLRHRGPDGEGSWIHPERSVGFTHRRLSIIDLETGQQPMTDSVGNWITYNGEIYNYIELRERLGGRSGYRTTSDTEVILRAYARKGRESVRDLRGMFAFGLWDERKRTLFCARDRFGIKPFYYAIVDRTFLFASEAKALLPFLPAIETDVDGLKDYLTFQFCLGGKTLFKGIRELPPGHFLEVRDGTVHIERYWDVYYRLDWDHTMTYFSEQTRALLDESVSLHLRSDVPVGAYMSGGLDSSIVATLASAHAKALLGFNGKFLEGDAYDESRYAQDVAKQCGFVLHEAAITPNDFVDSIERVIYHLDYPVAGPGSFPQFIVSRLAAEHRKVVLGGQGGDEVFGGYARYLIAYFEQCIKAAIDGTMRGGNFVVTYESIIPNLVALRAYKPLLQEFWREGLFDEADRRYYRLINRANTLRGEINWELLGPYEPFDTFREIFRGENVGKQSYFDAMTHFDFKTLLPALLQVEDRVSMAHGLESRVPFLDHPVVELAATMPADVKFKDGHMKHVLHESLGPLLPPSVRERADKMGFPVPLQDWLREPGPVRDFVRDVFSSRAALDRSLVNNRDVVSQLDREPKYGRKIWGLLSLELWQRTFHDRSAHFQKLTREEVVS